MLHSNLVLPEDLKCIPSEDLRDWVVDLVYQYSYDGMGTSYPIDCRWFVPECNDGAGPESEDGVPTNAAECCIWAGSYAGTASHTPSLPPLCHLKCITTILRGSSGCGPGLD
jgi:hypothetical protein